MSVEGSTSAETLDHGDHVVMLGFMGIFAVEALWLAGLAWLAHSAFGIVWGARVVLW